jgi:putative membrane protein
MKKFAFFFCMAAATALIACNDAGSDKDSVEKADSANEAKNERTPDSLQVDEATSDFLVKAADGGLAEVEAGRVGESKASNARVKSFAAMMVQDHTGANAQVKSLAAARRVTLPDQPSEEHKKDLADTNEKTGADFDKAYMKMMVDDHEETIRLFEKTLNDTKDEEVKTFINNTLPKLRAHLDSAQAIRKLVKG